MNVLETHFNYIEETLLAKSRIAKNSGNSLHAGTIREDFIQEFLEKHFSDCTSIGSGEIINCNTKEGDVRNQFDIILSNKMIPKISFSERVDGYFIESVNTTIEVKSTLTKKELRKSMKAANNVKKMQRNMKNLLELVDSTRPRIYNFLVAFDSSVKIETVHKWLKEIENEELWNQDNLPINNVERQNSISENLDCVIILGKGCVFFDNLSVSFSISEQLYQENPENKRIYLTQSKGNLLLLYLLLLKQIIYHSGDMIDIDTYLKKFESRSPMWGA